MIITRYTKDNIDALVAGDYDFYNELSLIEDKYSTLFAATGRHDVLKEFGTVRDSIEELLQNVFNSLKTTGGERVTCGTMCMTIDAWFDGEDFLNIDFYFNVA